MFHKDAVMIWVSVSGAESFIELSETLISEEDDEVVYLEMMKTGKCFPGKAKWDDQTSLLIRSKLKPPRIKYKLHFGSFKKKASY